MSDFSIEKFASTIPAISSTLLSCTAAVDKLSEYAYSITDKITYTLNQVDSLKVCVPELKDRLLECKSLLLKSHITASTVVQRIETCMEYGDLSQQEKEKIISEMKDGNSKPLSNYLRQLGRYCEQFDKCYTDFKVYDDSAQENCKMGKKECNERLTQAIGRKKKAEHGRSALQWGGVITGVGGLAGAAAVAGFFTFGIGTPIVLGIGAATSGVAAVGGATAAAMGTSIAGDVEDSYKKIEEALDAISKNFGRMKEVASDIDRDMLKLKQQVKEIRFDAEIVLEDEEFDSFKKAFNLLLKTISKTKKVMQSYYSRLEEGKKKVKKIE